MSRIFKYGLSLKTQVYGLIILISAISFCVRVITDVDTTRNYLQTQMASHAQDTATSLGLSISPYLEDDSLVIAETMATAIFDSGYYSQIKFTDVQNNIVFELQNPKRVESVPGWFISAVELSAPTMHSEINNMRSETDTLDCLNCHAISNAMRFTINDRKGIWLMLVAMLGGE